MEICVRSGAHPRRARGPRGAWEAAVAPPRRSPIGIEHAAAPAGLSSRNLKQARAGGIVNRDAWRHLGRRLFFLDGPAGQMAFFVDARRVNPIKTRFNQSQWCSLGKTQAGGAVPPNDFVVDN